MRDDTNKILWYLLCGSILLALGLLLVRNNPNIIKLDDAGITLIVMAMIHYIIAIVLPLFQDDGSIDEVPDYTENIKLKLALCRILKKTGECKYSIYLLKSKGYSDILNQYNYTEEYGYTNSDMIDCIYCESYLESLGVTRKLILKSELEDVEAMLNKQISEAENENK